VPFDEEAYDRASDRIKDMYCMLDLYQNITWPVLRGDLYSAVDQGIGAAFIDPITNFTNGMSATQANEFLQGFAQDAAVIAKDLNIPIFLFCHLNKPPKGNTPFDRGGKVTTDFFAGSSAMARSCNYAIAIEGNRDDELPVEERNRRDLVILADREYGEVGRVKLYWDWKTGLFNEIRA
jgi:twinkle protein